MLSPNLTDSRDSSVKIGRCSINKFWNQIFLSCKLMGMKMNPVPLKFESNRGSANHVEEAVSARVSSLDAWSKNLASSLHGRYLKKAERTHLLQRENDLSVNAASRWC
ncbi:hypothetical protein FRX31_006563 [Thalictrum thalictroides]|uniref:Uncharacterized protein n=1 Tax=Thalictrum thalictroides TaxID=46969 RepID=A0A7J6X290_THATH|nr:hypothetical protein FRX31_006563 [Thalictrum thalictroides]